MLELDIAALVVSIVSATVALFAALFAYWHQRTGETNLSLTAFLEYVKQLGSEKARKERNWVWNNLPDYSLELLNNSSSSVQLSENKKSECFIVSNPNQIASLFKNMTSHDIVTISPKAINKREEQIIWAVAVRFDRVGFILFELDLPKRLKEKYLEWMGETICGIWNKVAPYIENERQKRVHFVPYFDKLAYAAYPYYYKQKKRAKLKEKAKLVFLESSLIKRPRS